MGDKNNKSFSDLFSSISSDDDSSQEKKVTFDNLVDNVQSKKESTVSFSNISSSLENKEETTLKKDNTFETDKDNNGKKNGDNSFSFRDIFQTKIDDDSEKIKSVPLDENILNGNNEKTTDIIENPFFDDSYVKEDDKTVDEKKDLENKQIISDKNLFEKKEGNNPFFSDDGSLDGENTSEKQVMVEKKNTELDDNLKKEEVTEDSYLKDKKRDNPFFDGADFSKEVDENKADFSIDNSSSSDIELGNIFFKKDEEKEVENNSLNLENTSEEKSDFLSENLPSKSEEQIEKKSEVISPFFADNNDLGENYSSLGKINLVENDKQNKVAKKIDLSTVKHYDVKIEKKKEPLLKFILGVISYAIFIWLLLVGVALLVYVLDIKIRAAKGDYSSPTFNAYVVLTGSMLPEIQVYDVVVTKKVDPSSLEVGDVITFASADTRFLNTIITHRIIKKEYDNKTKSYSFQTQGDNNNVADSALVPQNNIYGKVILKIPKLGYLQEFLASDGGWIIVILIPCLTVVSYDVVKLVKGLKKKKYKSITVQK